MKNKIINAIKVSKGIILGAHINPDGDAVGALVGMATLCGFLHIPYQVILEKKPEKFYNIYLRKQIFCLQFHFLNLPKEIPRQEESNV